MPRVAKEIKCNENDILALEAIVRNPLSDPHLAMKARAILLCLDGRENKDVASELKVRNNTVGDWRKAYIEGGIEGLKGKKRPGRRGNNAPDKREMVREKLKEEPEGAGGKWTAQALAAAVGTSVDTVRRALREEGVCLERKTQWKVPVEGMPAPACIGIAGIYLSDAGKAVVLYSSGESRTDLSRGKIPTRNAASASGLEEMLSQDGYVPITDALEFLAQDAPAAGKRARKGVSLQEYLNGIGRAVEGREGAMLHAVVLPGKGEDFPALSCRSMSITLAPDFESWAALAGVWIDPLCGAGHLECRRGRSRQPGCRRRCKIPPSRRRFYRSRRRKYPPCQCVHHREGWQRDKQERGDSKWSSWRWGDQLRIPAGIGSFRRKGGARSFHRNEQRGKRAL